MLFFNITQYFDDTISNWPDRIAVFDGEARLSFSELRIRSLWCAKAISDILEGKKNTIVAVYLPKSIQSVVADTGILYSANAYMNLDIKNPSERIGNILAQTNPSLIITTSRLAGALKHFNRPMLLLDTLPESPLTDAELQGVLALRNTLIDTDPLCIINTSGSTGTPKGVVLNHRSFLDFTARVIELDLVKDKEIVGSLSPVIFDIYSFELCMLMAKGSALVLIPDSLAAFPARMLELLQQREVTYLFWVPTIMVNIANMDLLSSIALPKLRMVWFAGEVFPTAKFNYWQTKLPHVTFVNFYGPIEITLDCTFHIVKRPLRDDEPIPIGIPFPNTDVLVLDEEGRPVVDGKEGELCIRGSSLAMGYYNNPEKTAAAFVQNPLNTSYPELIYKTGDIVYKNTFGELVYKGRKDSMIKHMGYRIELTEIEHVVISSLDTIKNCCAIYDKEKKQIVLFFEATSAIESNDVRKRLAIALPRYMVPSVYVPMSELPRNTNGKIDRLRLSKAIAESSITFSEENGG